MKIPILLLRPDGKAYSAQDQSAGARLASRYEPLRDVIELQEEVFQRGDLESLEEKAQQWGRRARGIIGATNVPESTRLGEIAERLKVCCFVANNNPSVWRQRRHVFHIGLPTWQTAEAVAYWLERGKFGRAFLLHDETEFQSRVAINMKSALEKKNIQASSGSDTQSDWMNRLLAAGAAIIYLIYSAEKRALPLALACKTALPETPLLFGRSLLRQTFIESLGPAAEGALFVDLFRRGEAESAFMTALSKEGIGLATANHGFGWDALTLCGLALSEASGDVGLAMDYLESGLCLEGATGSFRFNRQDHNGRQGFGPTRISRWHKGRLEEAFNA